MNFLAHLYLSCDDDELLIGNYLADFLKNSELRLLPIGVQEGVKLHRKIDRYTDQHPIVRKGTRRLHAQHHKYAAVIIDIFYDYFLAKNWTKYSEISLDNFMQQAYQTLENKLDLMPSKLQLQTQDMIHHNWLRSYTTFEGLENTFWRLKRRVSKAEYLDNVISSLGRDESLLDEEFQAFFPDLIRYVRDECLCKDS